MAYSVKIFSTEIYSSKIADIFSWVVFSRLVDYKFEVAEFLVCTLLIFVLNSTQEIAYANHCVGDYLEATWRLVKDYLENGDYLETTLKPHGDYLVTTWRLLEDYLETT